MTFAYPQQARGSKRIDGKRLRFGLCGGVHGRTAFGAARAAGVGSWGFRGARPNWSSRTRPAQKASRLYARFSSFFFVVSISYPPAQPILRGVQWWHITVVLIMAGLVVVSVAYVFFEMGYKQAALLLIHGVASIGGASSRDILGWPR